MHFFKRKKSQNLPAIELNKTSVHALAILLFLSQLPHLLHLPIWISLLGMGIVSLKLLHSKGNKNKLLQSALSSGGMTLIALVSALLIRAHYGYFLGRDPCVAFLFILVSAKFAEVKRSGDATLLLCLSGFLLLTQYFYSQSIFIALITLPAVLALGNALMVLRDPENSHTMRKNVNIVGKLLLQGTPLAILLFFVFPRLPGPLWSLPDDATAKTGLSDSMSPGSIGKLSRSDEVAFRVEFDDEIPARHERYWRGPVLSVFDGANWSLGKPQLKIRPSGDAGSGIGYKVMLQPHKQKWLFALDNAVSLPQSITANPINSRVLATMTSDLQLLSNKTVSRVMQYKQSSDLSSSYVPVQAPSSLMTQTAGVNTKTHLMAQKLRATVDSDGAYAQAILDWFYNEKFHYTLEPTILGSQPVDDFLFNTRNGFCEHYSSAFVVLMRAVGIPARVVTGYLGGEMNDDYMIVRQSDAHAWAEAFINNRWQRFDPTGAVAPSRVESSLGAALGDGEPVPRMARLNSGWLKKMRLGMDKINHDWQRLIVDFNNESQFSMWKKFGLGRPALWQIMVLVILISVIWCIAVLGIPFLKGHHYTPSERLWKQYNDLASKYGVRRKPMETPADFVQRTANASGSAASDLQSIGAKLISLRFEQHTDNTGERNRQFSALSRKLVWITLSNALWQNRILSHFKM